MSKIIRKNKYKLARALLESENTKNPELQKTIASRVSTIDDETNDGQAGLSRGSAGAKAQKLCLEIMQQKFNRLFVGIGIKKTRHQWGQDWGQGIWKRDPRQAEKIAKRRLSQSDGEMLDYVGGGGNDPKTGQPRSMELRNDAGEKETLEVRFAARTAGVGSGTVDVQVHTVRANCVWMKKPIDVECKAGSGTIDVAHSSLVAAQNDWRSGTNGQPSGRSVGNPKGFNQSWGSDLASMKSALANKLKQDVYFFITDNADSLNSFKICRLHTASEIASDFVDMNSAAVTLLKKYVGNTSDAAEFLDRVLWGQDITYMNPTDIADKILYAPTPSGRSGRGLPSSLSSRTSWETSFEISIDKLKDSTSPRMDEFTTADYTATFMDLEGLDNPHVSASGRSYQAKREKTGDDYIDLRRKVNRDTIKGFSDQEREVGAFGLSRARSFLNNTSLQRSDMVGGSFKQGCEYIAREVNKLPDTSGVTAETIIQIAGTTDGFGNSCYGVFTKDNTGHSVFVLGTPPPLLPAGRRPRAQQRYNAIIQGFPEACRNYIRHLALQPRSWQQLHCNDIPANVQVAIEKANRGEDVNFGQVDLNWLESMSFFSRFGGELDFEYDMCQLPNSGKYERNTSAFSALLPPLHPHSLWHNLHLAWLASGKSMGRQGLPFRENYSIVGNLIDRPIIIESFENLLKFEPAIEKEIKLADEEEIEEIAPGVATIVETKQKDKYSLTSNLLN